MIDYAGFAARRAESKARGRLRGMGVSNTVEQASGPNVESAEIRFDASGGLTLLMGTISQGQGHDITYKQILCERLGIDSEHIRVFEGDTDRVTFGRGTFGSRSGVVGGTAICLAADKIVAKAKRIAGHLLEAAETDIEFKTGKFAVAGTDRSVSLIDIAKTAFVPTRLPPEIEPGLDETAQYLPRVPTFPNGCHMCEVEVDPETGKVEVVDYVVVDDVGTVLNPLLLKGQIHGGVAQGLGQALMEEIRFDPGSGQLLTGSFMDYALPRADDLPSIEVESNAVPTKSNPLGAKGAGEAGTVGALPTVMNAVLNALAPLGVREIPMPASPERIWRVLQEAKRHG
jgi:carbon-monoxide dehydrogenase large subunit